MKNVASFKNEMSGIRRALAGGVSLAQKTTRYGARGSVDVIYAI